MVQRRDTFLPYSTPFRDEREIEAVRGAIESGWWSRGPQVAQFETAFAALVGAKHSLAVNSGTAALELALRAHGVGPGDEVITTPMTFCATVNVIVHVGATPVLVDIYPDTGLIDPAAVEAAVTSRTRAIMPVHYGGQACDMDRITAIARAHGLVIVEDAAHAVWTSYKGKMIGGLGDATAFSFYATKNLATGEGGMLTSDDPDFIERARVLSLHGMSRNAWNRYEEGGGWRYDVVAPGFKFNMTDLAAALGLVQLDRLSAMQATREQYAAMYDEALADVAGVTPLRVNGYGRHARHLYAVRVDAERAGIDRDAFIQTLTRDYNVGTSVHFIPVHLHPYYRETFGLAEGDYPAAELMFSEVVSIPLYPAMSESDVTYVGGAIRDAVGQNRG